MQITNRFHLPRLFLLTVALCSAVFSAFFFAPAQKTHAESGYPLGYLAGQHNLLIGAAVSVNALQNDSTYRNLLTTQFSAVTPENEMKFAWVHPERYRYDFSAGDQLVSYAQQNGKTIRGHALVWHQAIPSWLPQGNFSRDEAISILRDHIFSVLDHYRGQVGIWDVVNEAVADPNEATTDPNGLRSDSYWYQTIGPDYIDMAFRFAHEADPNVQLFYNDYDGEGSGVKSDRIYNLVQRLINNGVPVNGIGLQSHIVSPDRVTYSDLVNNMNRLAALGLTIHITELDVWTSNISGSRDDKLNRQSQIYGDFLYACLEVPACKLITTWGVSDNYSWVRLFVGLTDDEPLLFDVYSQKKPAYYTLDYILDHYTGSH